RHHLSRHLCRVDGVPRHSAEWADGQALGLEEAPVSSWSRGKKLSGLASAEPAARLGSIAAVAVFLLLVFVIAPLAIASTHRTDLYYTLSSVALLAIASAGVWLTFYIGRINIGQGAFSLVGGYVSAVLVTRYGVSFWLSLPIAGLFCALASVLIGLPI